MQKLYYNDDREITARIGEDGEVHEMGERVLIAMSGGVDSSVAAYRMLEAGLCCIGANMRLRREAGPGASRSCCADRDAEDAAQAAAQLGIPFEILDYRAEFQAQVVDKFIRVYEAGGTPNPCIDCNRSLKFDRLLRDAEARGCHAVATGHYARVERDGPSGRWLLKKAVDAGKDQSYFLYGLTQYQLAHVRFPLGGMEKRQVRELAGELGLVNAGKRDSQDICFVPDGDHVAFMERCSGRAYPPGDFLDLEGRVVGRHKGAVRYTLGQRKGLGLAMDEPVYVCGKDMAANTVTVGPESALYAREALVEELNWISVEGLSAPLRVGAKTRSRQREQCAEIRPEAPGRVRLVFDRPQRAVTPGQAAVFYDGDTVVGGGTITEVPRGREEART